MKHLFVLISLLLLRADLSAQTTFIRDQDWESIKENAKNNRKMIFIDAYTDWCGWCKVMDEKTFSNEAIGKMMDQYFINVKLEMEKDELGIKLATKYAISSYPSYLVFNENGEFVYQTVGYQEPAEFMKTLFAIITPYNHVKRPGYSQHFDVVYPEFYTKVMSNSKKKKFPSTEDVNKWISNNNDLSQEANWTVFQRFYYDLDAKNREYFWKQKTVLDTLYGHDLTLDLATSFLYMDVKDLVSKNDPAKVEALLKVKLPLVNEPEETAQSIRLYYAKETKNWKDVNSQLSKRYKEKGIENASWWNEQCWEIYEEADDTLLIAQALIWIDSVVRINPDYSYLDTYAALLFKANKPEQAKLKAQEAIVNGKASQKNVGETEALLKKIDATLAAKEAEKQGSK
ncbi:MAG: thioredoxin family protein [Bacteroidia bacterium]